MFKAYWNDKQWERMNNKENGHWVVSLWHFKAKWAKNEEIKEISDKVIIQGLE